MNDHRLPEGFQKPKPLHNPFLSEWNGIKPGFNFTPRGMLMPREMQPPPMYGPRGATIPPKHLHQSPKLDLKPQPKIIKKVEASAPQKRFWCHTCEYDFVSKDELYEHKREHITCGIDECTFAGQASVVSEHIVNQHKSGLYDKIKKLDDPAEIAKWRDDRRKRYPSVRNVELRRKAQEERMKRGERLEKPKNRFGKRENRKQPQNNSKESFRNSRQQKKPKSRPVSTKTLESPVPVIAAEPPIPCVHTEEEDETNGNIKKFKGTSKMENFKVIKPKKKSLDKEANPLASLLGMYGSDDDTSTDNESSESDTVPESPIKASITAVSETEDGELSSGSEPEEIAIERKKEPEVVLSPSEVPKEIVEAKPAPSHGHKRSHAKKQSNPIPEKRKCILDYRKLRNHKPNTMLSKLLEPDIRHERNILLQCVRFVVENQFFDKINK